MDKAKPITISFRALLISINRLYHRSMSKEELYEATRGVWQLGPDHEKAEYAFSVYPGMVREAYRIEGWYKAGTLLYQTRDDGKFTQSDRWEFVGKVTEDIRSKQMGKVSKQPLKYEKMVAWDE